MKSYLLGGCVINDTMFWENAVILGEAIWDSVVWKSQLEALTFKLRTGEREQVSWKTFQIIEWPGGRKLSCGGEFHVSGWLAHRVPRYLFEHYSGASVKMFLHEINIQIGRVLKVHSPPPRAVRGRHPICWRPEQTKRLNKREFTLSACLSAGTLVFLRFQTDSSWNLHHRLSWFSGLRAQDGVVSSPPLGLQLADC